MNDDDLFVVGPMHGCALLVALLTPIAAFGLVWIAVVLGL